VAKRKLKRKPAVDRAELAEAGVMVPRAEMARHLVVLRKQARTDYVVDPEGRSVRWHYEREDRDYARLAGFDAFESWSKKDHWAVGRERFWAEMEERVVAHVKDRLFTQRLDDIGRVEKMLEATEKLLLPKTDKDGNVLLDEEGMPEFHLELPPLDRMAKTWLSLHERLMLLRGEAVPEKPPDAATKPSEHVRDPVSDTVNLSRDEVRYLARELVRIRQDEGEESDGSETEP
jgi:hypothetical protein